MGKKLGTNDSPSDSNFERDLGYTSRGRGYELGDLKPGYGDFKGNGAPPDNTQEHDVKGEGYTKKGTWESGSMNNETKSDKQPK